MTRKVWDAEMVARAAGLKRAGFTTKVIAERLGVSDSAVKNRLHRSGVQSRLDGRHGRYLSGFQTGRITVDVLSKQQIVNEYLELPEGEDE